MKNLIKFSLIAAAMVFTLGSCNCYKKMMKETETGMTASCSPEIITLKGDNAIGVVTITIPAKTFHQWGVAKVTPVIMWDGGEAAGTPVFVQGEKVKDNYKVIPYKAGGVVTVDVQIPYTPAMRLSKLVLKVEGKCLKQGNKIKEFTAYPTPIFVANAVSSLQLMADNYAQVAICPDALKRVTQINQDAKIMFQINRAEVRKAQLNSDEIAALQKFIIDNTGDAKKTVGDVYTQAYASPDGPLALNDKLSKQRGETTHKAVAAKFKKDKVPASTQFDINAMGEDWEGFKELVAASNIPDKDLILQVLSMYSEPQVRDREIKNMSAAFKVLAEKILPELRRSKMNVTVQVEGLTDAELKAAVAGDINTLTVEEMLFAATLYSDNATKAKCYKAAADKYNDYRAWNNLGCVMAWEGNYAAAKDNFVKAASINNSAPQVVNNLGVVALSEGKKAEAAKFFAASNTQEAKYNKGLVELANGNYSAAVGSLNGYNKGLAQLLNGDVAAAKATLGSVKGWRSDYVKAVIAAREGDAGAFLTNLKGALAQGGATAKQLAKTEVNFVNFFEHADFIAIVLN